MPMLRVKVDPDSGLAYIPKPVRDEGFIGEMDALPNALTFTLIRPGVTLRQAMRSLEIVLQDLEMRIQHKESQSTVENPTSSSGVV